MKGIRKEDRRWKEDKTRSKVRKTGDKGISNKTDE